MKLKAGLTRSNAESAFIRENPAFKNWFGDSKVIGADGRPLAMYHGTYIDFDAFDGKHIFHCFTPDPALAERHATDSYRHFKDDCSNAAIIVMPVYIRALRPFDPRTPECITLMEKWHLGRPSEYDYAEFDSLEDLSVVSRIRALGFDGIWMREGNYYNILAIFSPNQVKSSIGNSGRFYSDRNSLTDQGHVLETCLDAVALGLD
jgi:hypothetical protein